MSLSVPEKVTLRYTRRVLKGTDQWINVLTGGALGETISARAGRLQAKGVLVGCILCKFLDVFQKNHCQLAVAAEAPQT